MGGFDVPARSAGDLGADANGTSIAVIRSGRVHKERAPKFRQSLVRVGAPLDGSSSATFGEQYV
jgi:hypothetical protein